METNKHDVTEHYNYQISYWLLYLWEVLVLFCFSFTSFH